MDSLLNGQTIVCADLDFGLDSDLDGQGSALSLAGGVNADLRTADRLDAGSLDSLSKAVAKVQTFSVSATFTAYFFAEIFQLFS